MGRPSSIIGTTIQAKVDAMLDAGATYESIRLETKASLASLSRYNSFRKSHISRVIDSEPNMFDLVSRLVYAADDARDARQNSKLTGSPASRARAIRTEAELLTKILDSLGVDDARVAASMEQAHAVVLACRDHIANDQTPHDLIARIREIPGLTDAADSLAAHTPQEHS